MKFVRIAVACIACTTPLFATEKIQVLDESVVQHPELMISNWLTQQTEEAFEKWQQRYDTLKTAEEIEDYQLQQREQFKESLGGFPDRTPLNAQVVGITQRDGYRVEKVIFESQPQHFVTGLCFVPESSEYQAPYPGVLIVCGHSSDGKGYEGYQSAAALTALNGMISFIIDPICQGERYQSLDNEGNILIPSSTTAHTFVGLGAMLLGGNTARFEIWDGMRAIDYLQERGDVNPEKIGCMGNSGGGTQTAYLMALDDRIQAASPSCYLTSYQELLNTIGPQDAEQIIFGQLDRGMDHADYLLMRAPIPIMMCTATKDFFPIKGSWDSFRLAKRIYSRLGHSDRINLTENDATHGWKPPLREAAISWMSRWLAGRDVEIREPQIQILSPDELQVSPQGQVQMITGAKSVYDLNLEEYERLQSERDRLWSEPEAAVAKVREIAGIHALQDLPIPEAIQSGELQEGNVSVEKWLLKLPENIVLPALIYRPENADKGPLLFVHEQGKQEQSDQSSGNVSALSLAQAGHLVLAVDLRGTGETTPELAVWYNKIFGNDGRHVATAYLLGKNFVGLRAEDILVAARWFLDHEKVPADQQNLTLVAVGNVGLPALHAAVVEESMFGKLTLIGALTSWESILSSHTSKNQFVNCIHGALRSYDLQNLIEFLGERVEVVNPVDALGEPTH